MTSDARARPRDEEDAVTSAGPSAADGGETGAPQTAADTEETPEGSGTGEPDAVESDGDPGDGDTVDGTGPRDRARLSLPLVPMLAVLLVVLLGAGGVLFFTGPQRSAVRTGDYVDALQAARSAVVDLTSFDYLTLDDDIEQIRRIATGDLKKESVAQLDSRRQEITDAQAVANTEVVGAGVTSVDESDATVLMVIQATQRSAASPQAQVVRYRIRVELEKVEGRWLLSGLAGTEAP